MKIEKLPSGSYRARHTEDGKTYSIVLQFKPTQREAYDLLREKIDRKNRPKTMTFSEASQKYIDAKSNVLSPSTLRAYACMRRNLDSDIDNEQYRLSDVDIDKIDNALFQGFINELAPKKSPKYLANIRGFITAVVRFYYPDRTITATTPKNSKKDKFIPNAEQVKKLLHEAEESEYFVPLYLASMSCRRGEICALTIDDLDDDDTLHITKSRVQNEAGEWIVKPPKTEDSVREIKIPHNVAQRIREQGYVYKYIDNPNGIYNWLKRACKRLGMEQVSIHALRHFFASYAHEQGMSEQDIIEFGGWKTAGVMKKVYRHSLNKDEARAVICEKFSF